MAQVFKARCLSCHLFNSVRAQTETQIFVQFRMCKTVHFVTFSQTMSACLCLLITEFLGDRLQNGLPYAIGLLSCLSCLSVCDIGVLWPNSWMDQDETWRGDRPRPAATLCYMETHFPPQKGHSLPICGPCPLWPNSWWLKTPLGMEIGLDSADIVLPKEGHFSAHAYYGQTARWIKVPLGMKVGLGPGHIVLDGDPASPKGTAPPIFGSCLLWPNGWMDQDAT